MDIKGPKASPYCGGIFKVEIVLSSSSARAKFKPPIHHCNVVEKTGEVAFPRNMVGVGAAEILCTISDLLVTPASAPNQNDFAVELFKDDRIKYDSLARKSADTFYLAALDPELQLIPDVLNLFLPSLNISRRAQLEVFRRVALQELELGTPSTPAIQAHSQNLELEHAAEILHEQRSIIRVAKVKKNIGEALFELGHYATYGNPQFEKKMHSLEQELTRSYLRERVAPDLTKKL